MDQKLEIVNKCQDLLDKINQKLLQNNDNCQCVEEKIHKKDESNKHDFLQKNETQDYIDDIALIQSFYGTNIDRILATTTAIKQMLNSDPLPKDWIFIEAQKNKTDACFSWLKKYGIKYIFKKTSKEQDGLFLKTPLWNIGVLNTKMQKLCFIDSDVVLDKQNWAKLASDSLNSFHVISLSKTCNYENELNRQKTDSIGFVLANTQHKEIPSSLGHCGFTFGCTRSLYNQLNGFDCRVILDDIWTWSKIVGEKTMSSLNKWIASEIPDRFQKGLPVKIGYVDCNAWHMFHGNTFQRRYDQLTQIMKFSRNQIVYDSKKPDILPVWKSEDEIASIVKDSILSIEKYDYAIPAKKILFDSLKKHYGEIDDDHPLFICTSMQESYEQTIDDVIAMKENLELHCKNAFGFVCFSNAKDIPEEIDVIPLSKKFDQKNPWKECLRKDIKFQKDASILFIDIDENISKDFECYRCGNRCVDDWKQIVCDVNA